MKYVILIAYIVAASIGFYTWHWVLPKLNTPELTAPSDRDATLWKRGRRLYNFKCVACHNSNPDLPGSPGPALRGVSEETLVSTLTNGKGAMPPLKHMANFAKSFREYLK